MEYWRVGQASRIMRTTNGQSGRDRREFILGASAATVLLQALGVAAKGAAAQEPIATVVVPTPAGPTQVTWQEAMRATIGAAQPVEGRITITLPEVAETGNVVPITVSVDGPMTDQDFVKAVHIFSTANPRPDVASAYFGPLSGKAVFSGRMRLGQSQAVVVVAETSDGRAYIAKRAVKVTIGGCGTG